MLLPAALLLASASTGRPDALFKDVFLFWNAFRDPANGLYCGPLSLEGPVCGDDPKARYTSAGTGMGMVADCVFAEVGLLSRDEAMQRVNQTLTSLATRWPREKHHGFFVHFTDRAMDPKSEFSTVDTAEMTLGALFAGNYFGGYIRESAAALANLTAWSDAIEAADSPRIYPVVNGTTGVLSGTIRPFNEYYLVAYIAMLMEGGGGKAAKYFETFFGTASEPKGLGGYPVHLNYWGYELLGSYQRFPSSFIPQFCWFLAKGFHTNPYYAQKIFPNWAKADMKFWELALNDSATASGKKVKGRVWGCGAGPGPEGYMVERIDNSPDLVFSAAIMAGFMPAVPDLKSNITAQLQWLRANDVCQYELALPSGERPKVPWRCSIDLPEWKCPSADSIDFSTLVLGYATAFLPDDFYGKYAA